MLIYPDSSQLCESSLYRESGSVQEVELYRVQAVVTVALLNRLAARHPRLVLSKYGFAKPAVSLPHMSSS